MVLKKLGVEIETTVNMIRHDNIAGDSRYSDRDIVEIASDFGFDTHNDNSIRVTSRDVMAAEFVSPPREKMSVLKGDIQELYEQVQLVPNDSCGMHVHVSFDNPEDLLIMSSWDFVSSWQRDCLDPQKCPVSHLYRTKRAASHTKEYYRPYLNEQDLNETMLQSMADKDQNARYRSVNFHAWVKKGRRTIEFRSWATPTTADEACAIIDFTHKYVKEFLKSHAVSSLHPQLVCVNEEDDLSGESVIDIVMEHDDVHMIDQTDEEARQANIAVLYDGVHNRDW